MIQIQDDFVNQSQPPAPVLTDSSTQPIQVTQPVSDPVAPVVSSVDTVPSQSEQLNQAVQATMQKVEANTKNNAAEIDRLLAELDELSKNLESQVVTPSEVKSELAESTESAVVEPSAAVEPVVVHEAVMDSPILPTAAQSELTQDKAEASPAEEEEKFDFDAFLDDLEKKIDEESAKIKAAKAVDPQGDSVMPVDPAPSVAPTPVLEESTATLNKVDEEETEEVQDDFRKNRASNQALVEDQEAATEAVLAPDASDEQNTAASEESEELRAQNIFEMLGLAKISDEEKNQFLDELESMIWDDFVVHDLELLLTSEEYAKAREVLDSSSDENQKKEDLIVYLEKIVPDLDEVLYEKALELKSEMMGERLSKMKEGADEATLAKIKQAEGLISRNLWRQAATLLNG